MVIEIDLEKTVRELKNEIYVLYESLGVDKMRLNLDGIEL